MATGLERQTNLGIDKLIEIINNPYCGKKCLYINEIGVIFANKEDGHKKAEAVLLKLLRGKRDERFYAYCYLSFPQRKNRKIIQALRFFRAKPKNKELVRSAREKVKRKKEELRYVSVM